MVEQLVIASVAPNKGNRMWHILDDNVVKKIHTLLIMGKRSQIEPCHTQRTLLISEEICSKLYIIEIYEIMNTQYKTNGSIWSIWLSYTQKGNIHGVYIHDEINQIGKKVKLYYRGKSVDHENKTNYEPFNTI